MHARLGSKPNELAAALTTRDVCVQLTTLMFIVVLNMSEYLLDYSYMYISQSQSVCFGMIRDHSEREGGEMKVVVDSKCFGNTALWKDKVFQSNACPRSIW